MREAVARRNEEEAAVGAVDQACAVALVQPLERFEGIEDEGVEVMVLASEVVAADCAPSWKDGESDVLGSVHHHPQRVDDGDPVLVGSRNRELERGDVRQPVVGSLIEHQVHG